MEFNDKKIASIVENLIVGVCAFEWEDNKLTPCYINNGMWRMLGYNENDKKVIIANPRAAVIPEDLPIFEQLICDILKDDGVAEGIFRTVTPSGNLRWMQMRGNLYSSSGTKATIACVLLDITEKNRAEEELCIQASNLQLLSPTEQEIILEYNVRTDVMVLKQLKKDRLPFKTIFKDFLGKIDLHRYHPDDAGKMVLAYQQLLQSPHNITLETRISLSEDIYDWYRITLTSIAGGSEGSYVTNIVGRMISIHESRQIALERTVSEEMDALTGLYNRMSVERLITEELINAEPNLLHAVMVLNLDNFHPVNELYGNAVGDTVIHSVGEIIHTYFKGGDIAGRLEGDEFIVFLRDIGSISNIDVIAMKLIREIHKKIRNAFSDIHITSSIGISVFPYHGISYGELTDKAFHALSIAKTNGKDCYRIYDSITTRSFYAKQRYHTIEPSEDTSHIMQSTEDLALQILNDGKIREAAINTILELFAEKCGWQRAYVYPACKDTACVTEPIQYIQTGYEVGIEPNEKIVQRKMLFEYMYEQYSKLSIIHKYDNISNEVREYMVEDKVNAMLYYPLCISGDYRGCIVFQSHKQEEIILDIKQSEEIRSILRIMNTYLLQYNITGASYAPLSKIDIIDNMDSFIYIVDYATYRILFYNRKVLISTPNVKIGDYCYKILKERDTPCEDCLLKKMDRTNPHAKYSDEFLNYSTRTWMKFSSCWYECNQTQALGLISGVDISEYF